MEAAAVAEAAAAAAAAAAATAVVVQINFHIAEAVLEWKCVSESDTKADVSSVSLL